MLSGPAQVDEPDSAGNPRRMMGLRSPSSNRLHKTNATYGCYYVIRYRRRRAMSLTQVCEVGKVSSLLVYLCNKFILAIHEFVNVMICRLGHEKGRVKLNRSCHHTSPLKGGGANFKLSFPSLYRVRSE
ncbi:hypothetical protein ElyMa_002069600 [Elysia marginata]|uniref:Uncharacterized protein n=1 Tax=Elysia marginata TaxID=1093978 RepID=A0AAV4FBP4_9GAST|nr:hypothetical protein ElyMa_002069600 [Elysia marginata]